MTGPWGTRRGFPFFLDAGVITVFKKLINAWGEFISPRESAEQALGHDGGACSVALAKTSWP